MKWSVWAAVALALAGCYSGPRLGYTDDGQYKVTFDATPASRAVAQDKAWMMCRNRETVPTSTSEQTVEGKTTIAFTCAIPSGLGATRTTMASSWSRGTDAPAGVFVSCDNSLAHCYNRLSSICPAGFIIDREMMRGATTASLGSTTIGGSTNVAVATTGGVAVSAGPDPHWAAARLANVQYAAIAEASKEYGKVWAVCNE